MFTASNISKSFAGKYLFRNVTIHVNDGEIVALAGDNGTGKSTLLKIIAGIVSPDEGKIHCPRDTTFGYLPQDIVLESNRTLYEEMQEVFRDKLKIRDELREIEEHFEKHDYDEANYQKLLDRYGDLQEEMIRLDLYTVEQDIHDVLRGLGFKKRDWTRRVETFSGGWQMKIYLAKILLSRPTVLLLDEPTNHLDIDARNWLEEYLKNYKGSCLVVSHDRHFLDALVVRIYEIFSKTIETYHCSFSRYLEEREIRIDRIYQAKEKQDQEIQHHLEFIARNRVRKDRAQQVQSRIKMLEKMERIELPERRRRIKFKFLPVPHCSENVLEVAGLSKSYGEHRVFSNISFTIRRGDKAVLLGVNGAGKTTLMKILTGNLEPSDGIFEWGHGVKWAYFAQDQLHDLIPTNTVYEEAAREAPPSMHPRLRGLLGAFLFPGDEVKKAVGVLSGGERARLALCKLLLRESNVLLLDEPTNHLDVLAKDVLMDALQNYGGTVIFVSHDRYFTSHVATRVLELYEGSLRDYPGGYEDYREYKLRLNLDADPDDVR